MKVLSKAEKIVYEGLMSMIKKKKLRCWKLKTPEGFISESEREGFKEW